MSDTQSAQYLATYLNDLHSVWQPHPGQVPVGQALFGRGKKRVFVRCGRKWGKTEKLCYTLYRWAGTIPNGQFYYVAPYYNQAAEIIWHPGRLKNFLGPHMDKYIADIHETDRRVILKNGSFIKLVGSDNYEAGRGFNPDGAVYDEFKDHDYRFHSGFVDNLITKKAPLLIVGTPPETFDHFFCRTEEDFKLDDRGAYFKMPTHTNPYIDKEELEREKQSAIRKGEWAKYMREIEAEIVPGGANAIFPMFEIPRYDEKGDFVGVSKHVKEYDELMNEVRSSIKDWEFFAAYDPGSALCFAGIFGAVNRFSKRVIILDEIYEKDRFETSSKKIYPRAINIMNQINSNYQWFEVYDYAAAWFQNEVVNEFGVGLHPCEKDLNKKEEKLSLIKDFMLEGLFSVSKKCKGLIQEMSVYATDDNGKIPKKNDHAIDALRYLFNAAHLNTVPKNKYVRPDDRRTWTELDYADYDEIPEVFDFDQGETDEWFE